MKKMKLIPRIAYTCRMPKDDVDINGNIIAVVETFPYNPTSKSSPKTAKHWAQNGWGARGSVMVPPIFEFENNPFSIKLLRLEQRSQGGRAFKVIDDKCRLFDLREDQLIEAIRIDGISAGGQFNSTFVWGLRGSQITLVVVGGKVHGEMVMGTANELKKNEKLKKLPLFTQSALVPGTIYSQMNGRDFCAFVGKFKDPVKGKVLYAFVDAFSQDDIPCTCMRLLVSPKFLDRVGTIDVERYRVNKDCAYMYRYGDEVDAVLEHHRHVTGTDLPTGEDIIRKTYPNTYICYDSPIRKRAIAEVQRLTAAATMAYRDAIIWM